MAAGFSVYDFDDALQWDNGEGGALRRLAPKSRKTLLAARTADRVVAGNAVLADWASGHARDVVVIPSCVAPETYAHKGDYQLQDPPRLVWVGSPSEEHQLTAIAPALFELNRRTGARLTLIGGPGATPAGLDRVVDRVPWSEEAPRLLLSKVDVGVMPLADTPMDRGKCGYKLLQYLAAGLPAVASPVGVNTEILRRAGLPAPSTSDEWLSALLSLLESSASGRATLGSRARRTVEVHYSYDVWRPAWEAALELT
jgi:glycosyltransferase involved in cell wall biosynthesis